MDAEMTALTSAQAARLGLVLDDETAGRVAIHLETLIAMGAVFQAVELPPEAEPLPIFVP